jgi:hypothetical protein
LWWNRGPSALDGKSRVDQRTKTLNKSSGASFDEWMAVVLAEVESLLPGATLENLDAWRASYDNDEFVAEVLSGALLSESDCPRDLLSPRPPRQRTGRFGYRRRRPARLLVARRRR